MKRLSGWTVALALQLAAASAAVAQKAGAKGKATAPGPAKPAPAAPEAGAAGAPDAGPGVKVERGAGGKKIYRIVEGIQITGKIQKPEAFYVLQNSGINYEWTELKQDFLPKILESVSKAPF
jgi:hypothetical protein